MHWPLERRKKKKEGGGGGGGGGEQWQNNVYRPYHSLWLKTENTSTLKKHNYNCFSSVLLSVLPV